jgi:aromatic ring-opening dioxygenase LigB subunit
MPIVYACIAPHGGDAIPQLASKSTLPKFEATRQGLRKLANEIANKKPDTVVIATPHNLRLRRYIGIVTAENSSGRLHGPRPRKTSVSLKVKCDQEFAEQLLSSTVRKKLPVAGANYGTAQGATSDMPMDYGTLVPLWFIMKQSRRKPKVVIVTPSREIPLSQNYEFGHAVAALAEKKSKKYVFVASADQAHAHKKSGPYAFSRTAAVYDRLVLDAIRTNKINRLMNLKTKLVEDAKPDSLWQMTMLAGVLSKVNLCLELSSYQVPTYYGTICAGFRRTD